MEAHRIAIVVDLNAAGVATGSRAALAALGGLERGTTSTLGRMRTAFAGLSFGQKAFAGVTLAAGLFATGLGAVIGPAIEFESAFAGVRKTVDGTPAQLAGIRQGLLDMSSVMPTTAVELAAIAENAGQLGVAAPDVLNFTEVIAQLGETTDLSFEGGAQSLARFLNVMEGGVGRVSPVSDALVDLGNNSATTESQILSFATRTASAGQAIGLTSEEVLAFAASFSSAGIQSEAGGSALSRVLIKIRDAAIDGGESLDILSEITGILPNDFRRLVDEDPSEALLEVGRGLNRITEGGGSTSQIIKDLGLQGIRTEGLLRVLAVTNDDVALSVARARAAAEEGGARLAEYGNRAETTASRIEILKGRLNALAINIGTPALGAFAAAADVAGDAVVGIASALAPLGSQIVSTFTNAAQAAGLFYDVIGGPAIGLLAAALTGASVALGGVAAGFNALGTAGVVIAGLAAAVLAFNAATGGAVIAVQVLALELRGLGAAGLLAKVGITSVGTALIAGGLVAGTAVLIGVGKALNDARSQGEEAARVFRDELSGSIDTGRFDEAARSISNTRDRIAELEELDRVPDGLADSWSGFGNSVLSVGQILTPFTENTMVNARAEAEALAAEMGRTSERVDALADIYGVSNARILEAADATGVLNDIQSGTGPAYQQAQLAVQDYLSTQDALAEGLGLTVAELGNAELSLSSYAEKVGASEQLLAVLADRIDGVDLSAIVGDDPDAFDETDIALQGVLARMEGVAAAAGLTTAEMDAQVVSANALAAAHSNLGEAIAGARSALELLEAQERAVADASTALEDAVTGIDLGEESFVAAAGAAREYLLQFAGSGVSVDQFMAEQARVRGELIDVAVGMGYTRERARELFAEYGLVPPSLLTEVIWEGQNAAAEAEFWKRTLEELDQDIENTLFLDADQARAEFAAAQGLGGEWRNADLLAILNLDPDEAMAGFELAIGRGNAFAEGPYNAELTADGSQSEAETSTRRQDQLEWADADYLAFLTANGAQAEQETSDRRADQNDYASAAYLAFLTANGSQARGETSDRKDQADAYAGTYTATLRAVDNASGTIAKAVGSLSQFKSKTITIRVNRVTQSENGGIISGLTGYNTFEDGGLNLQQGVVERPGRAKIYKAAFPFRVFAEPPTGDEAFIPLGRGKRAQALPVLAEVLDRFGLPRVVTSGARFENGGILQRASMPRVVAGGGSGGISIWIDAPIQITGVPGMTENEARELVKTTVAGEFRQAGRKLARARIS